MTHARQPSPSGIQFALVAGVAIAALLLPSGLFAQGQGGVTTGSIRGTVTDPTGSPVPGAEVRVVNDDTGLTRAVATNQQGRFVIQLLPVGSYDVTVRAIGQFGAIENQDVIVRLGEAVTLSLQFQPVEMSEIRVTGQAELVDEDDPTSSQRFSEEAVDNLPNNGRNFLDFSKLTPGVSTVQGPDGEELTINGQRGIFNNVIVDGADFNNPFFGEQRGGQRPAFTFNQEAVEEMVVINQGAPAEYGRTAGGIVNVLTKSGTNELDGSIHYFGQFDETSSDLPSNRCTPTSETPNLCNPPFFQHQFGLTLGGPIVEDKAFFFIAYDQQEFTQTKQLNRVQTIENVEDFERLRNFFDDAFGGALAEDFQPIERTDDAKAIMVKLDWNVSEKHSASVKYNYSWSKQVNGTFDVDAFGRSANGIERDFSHAVNGSLKSQLSSTVSNEFRFQWAKEERPRPYEGPLIPGATPPALPQFDAIGGRPFPSTRIDLAEGFRIGKPFFLPIDPAFDTRIQIADNVSFLKGNHLFKLGTEWNRTTVKQQFIGFSNGTFIFNDVDGFINYVQNGRDYVTCSDGSDSTDGTCPDGTTITGPINTYLQAATVPGVPTDQLGLQSFDQNELAFFAQDTWNPTDNVTLNYGVRWEGTWMPEMFIEPEDTFYGPFLGETRDGQEFPSTGRIPDDLNNFQPRFSFNWDVTGDTENVVRLNAGSYFARIPSLVFAQHRTTNGAFQQLIFTNSALRNVVGAPPDYDELLSTGDALPFLPQIQVPSKDLELPRTWSFGAEYTRRIGDHVAASVNYTHARTDNLFRFVDRNDPVFGSPWSTGLPADFRDEPTPGDMSNGIGQLIVTESTARSRYNGITLGLKGAGIADGRVQFEMNYTLSFDKSDDDNERDPFTLRYARADRLEREYNWSDRDQRHRANFYILTRLPGDFMVTNIVQGQSAQPVSEACVNNQPSGERAASPAARICDDGTILKRNTLRKENDLFRWDVRVSKRFDVLRGQQLEVIAEVFNVTNTDNFLDTSIGSLAFNFDGTIRSGLGDPRRVQVGARWHF